MKSNPSPTRSHAVHEALEREGKSAASPDPAAFAAWLAEQCRRDWVVYAKPPFGGPDRC